MEGAAPVTLSVADGVARITLDDPANRNAVTQRSSAAFLKAARDAVTHPEVRVILLVGSGGYFSVGGDIEEFLASGEGMERHVATLTDHIHSGIRHLVQAPIPVVVGLNGIAAGGGVGMMLSGDVIVATRSAKINSGYTRSGLTPDAGLTWFLPPLVGHARAFEIVAFNEFLSAELALSLGIVSRVVDDANFEAELETVVERLMSMPGPVLGEAKRLLRQGADAILERQLDTEARQIIKSVGRPDTLRALRVFAKR